MKKILIINGHSVAKIFCFALAKSYKKYAEQCRLVHLVNLKFNLRRTHGYSLVSELETDLLKIQQDLLHTNHLVFVYPIRLATFPALLKGFFKRVFIPNFTFWYLEKGRFWDKLFKGKTARLIVTMDTPKWYYCSVNSGAGHNAIKSGVLEFCGVKPVKISVFAPGKSSDEKKRKKNGWMKMNC